MKITATYLCLLITSIISAEELAVKPPAPPEDFNTTSEPKSEKQVMCTDLSSLSTHEKAERIRSMIAELNKNVDTQKRLLKEIDTIGTSVEEIMSKTLASHSPEELSELRAEMKILSNKTKSLEKEQQDLRLRREQIEDERLELMGEPYHERIVQDRSGSDRKIWPNFQVNSRWSIQWDSDAAQFSITIFKSTGERVALISSPRGVQEFESPGEYYTECKGRGTWKFKVTRLPQH